MNPEYLEIIALFLVGVCIGGSFKPRFPSTATAYAALLCMYAGHRDGIVVASDLVFWAVASALVVGMRFLQPRTLTNASQGHSFVNIGTLAGVLTGFVINPSSAAIILGGCLGAFAGTLAFMRMPRGPHFSIGSSQFMQYLCAKGLPAVVWCSMAAITIVCIL